MFVTSHSLKNKKQNILFSFTYFSLQIKFCQRLIVDRAGDIFSVNRGNKALFFICCPLFFKLPKGVQEHFSLPEFMLQNWRCVYDAPYSDVTTMELVDDGNLDECIMWGATYTAFTENTM